MIQIALIISVAVIFLVLLVCILIWHMREHRNIYRGSKLKFDIGNAQIIGNREKQDDSFGMSLRPYAVFAMVADGIGGYQDGKLASEIAVATYINEFEKRDVTENLTYFFQKSAVLANSNIRDEFGEVKGGTTQVSVVIVEDRMYWSSVGDSNIAVLRNGRLIEVNRKENVKNWLEDQYYAGMIGREVPSPAVVGGGGSLSFFNNIIHLLIFILYRQRRNRVFDRGELSPLPNR